MTRRATGWITLPPPPLRLAWKRFGVYALLLFVVSAWGGSFVAARMLLAPRQPGAATLSPTLLATVRFLLASLVFLPILYRQHRRVQRLRLADLPTFALLGQLGIALYFWLQYTGVRLTNASIAAVIVVGLIPLATMVVSGITLREPLGGRRALALALGAVGVLVVVSQQGLRVAARSGFLLGALCLVGNALCFAIYSTVIRGIRGRYSALTTTAGMTVAGTVGLMLLALFSGDLRSLAALSVAQWLAIAYLGLVCSVLAYFFYNYALSQIEASKAAAWIYLEPPVAVALGALLLGEAITAQTVVGGVVILASLLLVQRA
jgi:drug/metabolite transporter (DMT)-like permease